MRKLVAFVVVVVACLCSAMAIAQPAQKAAASSSTAILFRAPTFGNVPDAGAWVTVLETNIKPPGGKDLFIGFSAVSEIETVNFNGATGGFTFSFADGAIFVRVLVDGAPATPGVIPFNILENFTSTRLSTQLSNCTEVDVGPNAGKVTCASTPGLLDTLLFQASANTYNFIKQDVSPGTSHNIKVQAQFFANSSGGSFAEALMGARTLTVEQVALDAQ